MYISILPFDLGRQEAFGGCVGTLVVAMVHLVETVGLPVTEDGLEQRRTASDS
jgi:hypothetical protein